MYNNCLQNLCQLFSLLQFFFSKNSLTIKEFVQGWQTFGKAVKFAYRSFNIFGPNLFFEFLKFLYSVEFEKPNAVQI